MKNESRIEALLAESLQKQDQLAEKVGDLTSAVGGMTNAFSTLTSAVGDLRNIAERQLKVTEGYVGALREVRDDLKADIRDLSIQVSKQTYLQRQINDITERLDQLENPS